jgi:hypothetical protein
MYSLRGCETQETHDDGHMFDKMALGVGLMDITVRVHANLATLIVALRRVYWVG